jgi:hypothetical protein
MTVHRDKDPVTYQYQIQEDFNTEQYLWEHLKSCIMNDAVTANQMGNPVGAGVSQAADKAGCFWAVGKEVWVSQRFVGTLQLCIKTDTVFVEVSV